MRKIVFGLALFFVLFNLVFLVWEPQETFFWNRTESAPTGLYWLNDDHYSYGDWVIVSAKSADAKWVQARGYIGRDWAIIKRVSGLPGDVVCRDGNLVSIDGAFVGAAKECDRSGRALPVWSGCVRLTADEVFLLNRHPDSLDGRYFGPTKKANLLGRAHKVGLSKRRVSAVTRTLGICGK